MELQWFRGCSRKRCPKSRLLRGLRGAEADVRWVGDRISSSECRFIAGTYLASGRRPYSVPVHFENLDPAAGGLRQLDPTAFSVCAVLENAPSAR